MFNDTEWSNNTFLDLYTDSSGNSNLGCDCYFKGQWCAFKWPRHWETKKHGALRYTYISKWLLQDSSSEVVLKCDHELIKTFQSESTQSILIAAKMLNLSKLVLTIYKVNIFPFSSKNHSFQTLNDKVS